MGLASHRLMSFTYISNKLYYMCVNVVLGILAPKFMLDDNALRHSQMAELVLNQMACSFWACFFMDKDKTDVRNTRVVESLLTCCMGSRVSDVADAGVCRRLRQSRCEQ